MQVQNILDALDCGDSDIDGYIDDSDNDEDLNLTQNPVGILLTNY